MALQYQRALKVAARIDGSGIAEPFANNGDSYAQRQNKNSA